MTIKISDDEGKTWRPGETIHEGPSAYSNLVSFANGDVGILYEGGSQRPYEGIAFELLTPKMLLDED